MFENILNKDYYELLIGKFSENIEYNSAILPISRFNKINLSFLKKAINKKTGFNLFISIPRVYKTLMDELFSNIYLFVANQEFYENYINPDFRIDELVIRITGKKNRKYKIGAITDKQFSLVEQKKESFKDLNGPATIYIDKNNMIKDFVPIKRGIKKRSLNNFFNLFASLNSLNVNEDYFPTKFAYVSIIIGTKKLFDNFRNVSIEGGNLWNSIPCHYINREGKEHDTLGISPLLYFAPSYRIAYQQIIQNQIKVSNIILFNAGFDELQQILNDQYQYNFKIAGVNSGIIENIVPQVNYWEWRKEEINIINLL